MIALLTALLFVLAAFAALGTIAVTVLPQRQRIAQLLGDGLGTVRPARVDTGRVIAVEFSRSAAIATAPLRAAA